MFLMGKKDNAKSFGSLIGVVIVLIIAPSLILWMVNSMLVHSKSINESLADTPISQTNSTSNTFIYNPTDYIIGLDDVQFGGIVSYYRNFNVSAISFVIDSVPFYYQVPVHSSSVFMENEPLAIYSIKGKTVVVYDIDEDNNSISLEVND